MLEDNSKLLKRVAAVGCRERRNGLSAGNRNEVQPKLWPLSQCPVLDTLIWLLFTPATNYCHLQDLALWNGAGIFFSTEQFAVLLHQVVTTNILFKQSHCPWVPVSTCGSRAQSKFEHITSKSVGSCSILLLLWVWATLSELTDIVCLRY